VYQKNVIERRARRGALLRRNGSMFGSEGLALIEECLLLAFNIRLMFLKTLADMPICLSLLARHFEQIVIERMGRQQRASPRAA
jgi:hypothetical protein